MKIRRFIITILAAILSLRSFESPRTQRASVPIDELLSQVNESEILATASALQGFVTRVVGYQGNVEAGTYLYNRFAAIPRLSVAYQGGSIRNVVATLPGTDATSDKVYIVGAHYDSTSSTPASAPGATDNGCGVGIVLELARIMSKYTFKNDLKFAAWNGEENGLLGSNAYVNEAELSLENIQLYFNYDSAGYDPEGRLILDIMYNALSSGVAERMDQLNSLYGIGFTITENVHTCTSDHRPFWAHGFCSVMTHSEQHGPAHTPNDTVDKISTLYAQKNGQLGMAILAELAGLEAEIKVPTGYYVLDGYGGVHAGGGASLLSPATPYFGWDIAKDIELMASGGGHYVLDGFGGVHAGGGASSLSPATPYFGWDIARDVEMTPNETGYYVLDGYGGVHAGGSASSLSPPTPYFGWNIAQDLELSPSGTGYYVLDGYGGVHAGGGASSLSPATPYFGWNIARDLEVTSNGTGYYVLDGYGGVHMGGSAPAVVPFSPYFGFDIAKDLEFTADGLSYYVLDGYGGIHNGGSAPSLSPPTAYFGWNIARALALLE